MSNDQSPELANLRTQLASALARLAELPEEQRQIVAERIRILHSSRMEQLDSIRNWLQQHRTLPPDAQFQQ